MLAGMSTALFATHRSRAVRRYDAFDLLSRVQPVVQADRKLPEMSSGVRQRVGIARALANRPTVPLADEPTGILGSRERGERRLPQLHRNKGLTIVMVTHDT